MSAPPLKLTKTCAIAGAQWVGTSHLLFVAVGPTPEGLAAVDGASVLADMAPRATGDVATRSAAPKGYPMLGPRAFCAHFLDAIEAAHPGVAWHLLPGAEDPVVGFVGAAPVAIVMPIRADPFAENAADVSPACPTCDGDKRARDCSDCGGDGVVECDLGHEHDCEECDGDGRVGKCKACGGTGKWSEGQVAA